MEQTVQLSQKQKLKKFNEKLQMMMKNKNIDKTKLGVLAPVVAKKQQQSQQRKQTSNQYKPEALDSEKRQTEQKQKLDEQKVNPDKTKQIRKDRKKNQSDVTIRKAAGMVWKDKTLQQWPQNDYRIFVGNLGNQVTDQMLSAIFRNKYNSFQMGKVVLDKRTGKTRGYGFVSFKQPKDFLNALKQMNGKYIGNRPVKITKSSWKERSLQSAKNKQLPSDFKAISGKQTNKICINYKYVSPL